MPRRQGSWCAHRARGGELKLGMAPVGAAVDPVTDVAHDAAHYLDHFEGASHGPSRTDLVGQAGHLRTLVPLYAGPGLIK